MEIGLILIFLGATNLIFCLLVFIQQTKINTDTARSLERLNRRLKDLESRNRFE